VVVTAVPGGVSGPIVSRLAARARQRGSVLVPFGDWSGADVTLQVGSGRWEGLGAGHGRLRRREVTVIARGRGAAARPRETTMWMPGVTAHAKIPPRRPQSEPVTPAAAIPLDLVEVGRDGVAQVHKIEKKRGESKRGGLGHGFGAGA
jgi:hypothetical protein